MQQAILPYLAYSTLEKITEAVLFIFLIGQFSLGRSLGPGSRRY
jgi:hypothetical protein